MSKDKEKPKTFGKLRKEWMPGGGSDNIDYRIPICIGVVAQDKKSDTLNVEYELEQSEKNNLDDAMKSIMLQLNKDFGSFEWYRKSDSKRVQKKTVYNKLLVMSPCKNSRERYIVKLLEDNYNAYCIKPDNNSQAADVTYDDVAELCWGAIAVWDGVNASGNVYNTVHKIINTECITDKIQENGQSDKEITYKQINYQLKSPELKPVYELFLPIEGKSDSLDYTYRRVFQHYASTESSWIFRNNRPDDNNEFIKHQEENFLKNVERTNQVNRRVAKFSKGIDKNCKGIYDLLPHYHGKDKESGKSRPIPEYADVTNLRFLCYDMIATLSRNRQRHLTIALIIISGIALTFFSLYSDLINSILLLFLYIFGIFIAYIFLWKNNTHGVHSDYLEFRALAEALRVQCYWYMSGINESAGAYYTVKFQKNMIWAKQALNAWYLMDSAGKHDSSYKPDFDLIRREWLGELNEDELETAPKICAECGGGQLGFYKDRVKKSVKKSKKWNKRNGIFIAASLSVSVILLILVLLNAISDIQQNIGMFLMSVLNIITIAIACYTKVEAYSELASKYSYCAQFTIIALQDYDRCCNKDIGEMSEKTKAAIQAIFKQFGVEALEENSEWLMIKNDREPEVMN